MSRWIYKPIAAWRDRRPYWLQKYTLAFMTGFVIFTVITVGVMHLLGYPHPGHVQIGQVATNSPTGP